MRLANVAVFGRRPSWPYPEGDDTIRASGVGGETANLDEGRRIGDDVVGGQRYQQSIFVALGRKCSARGNSGAGIPPHRFKQDVGLGPNRRQLLGHEKAVLIIGHDDRPTEEGRIRHPPDGILERRMRTKQRQELLGTSFARGRPQPRAGAAAHDQRDDRWSQFRSYSGLRENSRSAGKLVTRLI